MKFLHVFTVVLLAIAFAIGSASADRPHIILPTYRPPPRTPPPTTWV